MEKIIDLYPGTSIWKCHIDALREQDKNARVMPPEKFKRLIANIRKDKRLESLPLCVQRKNPAGNDELLIISGHHRVRAARMANVTKIFVQSIDEELTKDEITSKQLAHNALDGYDDLQLVAELYNDIKSLEQKSLRELPRRNY